MRNPKSCCSKNVVYFHGKNLRQDETSARIKPVAPSAPVGTQSRGAAMALDAKGQHSPLPPAHRNPERPSPARHGAAPLTGGGFPLVAQRGSVVGHRPGRGGAGQGRLRWGAHGAGREKRILPLHGALGKQRGHGVIWGERREVGVFC